MTTPSRQRRVPLAPRQEWLWAMMRCFNPADPANASHVMQQVLRLRGPIQVRVLERAVNEIVRRHGVLRTTFDSLGSRPTQLVAAELALPLSVASGSGPAQPAGRPLCCSGS